MAATQTVPQYVQHCNFTQIVPRHGVMTLFGYGIRVQVERGHLILEDGIGSDRRRARFARVAHGLRRLVVIGSDGMVSLAALRWLGDQDAAFVMLDRNGSLLLTSGPVYPSDARLRRAQALAHTNGTATQICRELIGQKLAGQERLAREGLATLEISKRISNLTEQVRESSSMDEILGCESKAAGLYWSAWADLPIQFPQRDLHRVPCHWLRFGNRVSPLTGSPRLAVNPPNAILNYLYAILEAEARLAAATLGLDPGLGFWHLDRPNRDSLACDLMEPVRPLVDSFVLDWIKRTPFRRDWFFEDRNGNCRLMGSFVSQLTETAPTWRKALGPIAELVVKLLWAGRSKSIQRKMPATRLTQAHRRTPETIDAHPIKAVPPRPELICKNCGSPVSADSTYCFQCGKDVSRKNLIEAAKLGRIATHSPKAELLRSLTQKRQAQARYSWKPSDLPHWLTGEVYKQRVQPRLIGFTVKSISSAIGVSEPYATRIRRGESIPHPRHWLLLANLAGISN